MTLAESDTSPRPGISTALMALGLLWMDFFSVFKTEWSVNEQYNYGFLVPFLTAYLLYRRWDDRPACRVTDFSGFFWTGMFGIMLAAIVPLRLILAGNPEWRLALWLYAISVVAATLCLMGRLGGWRWLRHFALPCALLLFAVPWPTAVEGYLVRGLMGTVSAVTVECLNLLGIYAEQHGNIIRLSSGSVGVEEACSGVRSFQSTFMAAFFLGEFFRWRLTWRAGLIITGCLVSILLNIGRALTLTLVTVKRGPDAMAVIHDPMGHFVSITAFLTLLGICALLERFIGSPGDDDSGVEEPAGHRLCRMPTKAPALIWLVLIALAGSHAFTYLWYRTADLQGTDSMNLQPDWAALDGSVTEREINPAVRAQLRYSEGQQMEWEDRGRRWTAFYFNWDEGRVSSHVGVHRPENCLPSAGYRFVEQGLPFSLAVADNRINFSASTFDAVGSPLHVFYAVWDRYPSHAVPMGSSARDRLTHVWNRQRIRGRQSMQLVVINEPDARAAGRQAEAVVRQLLGAPDQ